MELHQRALLHLAFVVRSLINRVGFADERQRRAVRTSGRFDDMRNKPFARLIVEVGQILATAFVLWLAVLIEFHDQFAVLVLAQLTFGVRSQVEVATMSHTFQFAVFAV